MTKKKTANEEPKAEAAEAQAEAPKQEAVTLTLPPYQALMIVGVTEKGSIFHHFAGQSMNVMSMVGLSKYMDALVAKLLGKALPENIQKL